MMLGGPNFPLVQIVCENCSYVMHFASTSIGLDSHAKQLLDQREDESLSSFQPEA